MNWRTLKETETSSEENSKTCLNLKETTKTTIKGGMSNHPKRLLGSSLNKKRGTGQQILQIDRTTSPLNKESKAPRRINT